MRYLPWASLLGLAICLFACDSSPERGTQTAKPQESPSQSTLSSCETGTADDSAFVPKGYNAETNSAVLMNGQTVTPAGKTLDLQRFAWGVALSPDGKTAYITNAEGGSQSVQAIDLSQEDLAPLTDPARMLAGYGLTVSSDGQRIYVPGAATGLVHVLTLTEGAFVTQEPIHLQGYLGALALSSDDQTLFALSPTQAVLSKVTLATGEIVRLDVGFYPYDVVLSTDGSKAFVSDQGANRVVRVNTQTMTLDGQVDTDRGPEGLALAEDEAYLIVACADDETIQIIKTEDMSLHQTLELDPEHPDLKVWTPNAVAVHPEAHRAYITAADRNAVEVLDTETWTILGQIPTAFYPSRIAITPDEKLVIVNSKGWGLTGSARSTGSGLYGLLQVVDVPANATELEQYSRQVKQNVERPQGYYPDNQCDTIVPLPLSEEETSVIEHIVLVVKENKVYDEILGDLAGPEGDEWHDPNLAVLFGENVILSDDTPASVTPNAHAIARRWVDFVNYYCDSEVSLQGHMWTTQADCNDFVERTHFDRTPLTGIDPMTKHENGTIFQHLDNHGFNFRVYGEAVNFGPEEVIKWRDKVDLKYPYWSMGQTDVLKAQEVIREWELSLEMEEPRLFPSFIYIVLPNDHTAGANAGALHPQTMVADNDHAMGMLVDWLSKSPYWEKTLFIALQDDGQTSMGDHIDAHRSVLYLASPWVKRNYQSRVHYSMPSVFRTIELILGLPPMNKNTLLAPPLIDVFTDEMDTTGFDAIVPTMPVIVNPSTGPFAEEAKQWDWSGFDGHKGLGDHVYRYLMGDKPRPDYVKMLDD